MFERVYINPKECFDSILVWAFILSFKTGLKILGVENMIIEVR
jgi:hypothetical protein